MYVHMHVHVKWQVLGGLVSFLDRRPHSRRSVVMSLRVQLVKSVEGLNYEI